MFGKLKGIEIVGEKWTDTQALARKVMLMVLRLGQGTTTKDKSKHWTMQRGCCRWLLMHDERPGE